MMIVGHDLLTRSDSSALLSKVKDMAGKLNFVNAEAGWNGYNVLHRNQGEINALELGIDFNRAPSKTPKVIFLLGADNGVTPESIPKDSFVVYIVRVF